MYWRIVGGLFVLFVVLTSAFLHRVPGLLGDEASEGENVYEILHIDPLTVVGERSYIGPLIDYVRVPFVLLFGYTALPLRLVVLLFSWGMFWLLAFVLRRAFPPEQALMGLVLVVFSPIYLTQSRLGWAITLLPFFTVAPLAVLLTRWRYRWLAAGLLVGLGLATHILFLPTAIAFVAGGALVVGIHIRRGWGVLRHDLAAVLLAFVGFWAGFGSQFAVLQLFTDDQGEPAAVAETVGGRGAALPKLLVLLVSGSSYIARYTGVELSSQVQLVLTLVVGGLALAGVVSSLRRRVGWLLAVGLLVHAVVLLYMIDRFTLRYFVTLTLMVWLLAGLGAGWLAALTARRWTSASWWGWGVPIAAAGGLSAWFGLAVLVPFLVRGGSTADFSLANRTDSAAALVDVRPLVSCLTDAGPVYSENVHIWNRLQYVSHGRDDLTVVAEDAADQAQWLVHYRTPAGTRGAEDCAETVEERCPELKNFCIVPVR